MDKELEKKRDEYIDHLKSRLKDEKGLDTDESYVHLAKCVWQKCHDEMQKELHGVRDLADHLMTEYEEYKAREAKLVEALDLLASDDWHFTYKRTINGVREYVSKPVIDIQGIARKALAEVKE